jgi:hypothetical protein
MRWRTSSLVQIMRLRTSAATTSFAWVLREQRSGQILMRRESYRGTHIPLGRSKLWEYVIHGEILHLSFYIGMAHREWGQSRKHIESTEALRCSRVRVEDAVDKVKDREEGHLSTTADELAEEGRRCRHGG